MRRKSERKPKETKASPEKPRRSNRSSRRKKKSSSSEAESEAAEVDSSDNEEVIPEKRTKRSRKQTEESENDKSLSEASSSRSSKQTRRQFTADDTETDVSKVEVPKEDGEEGAKENSMVSTEKDSSQIGATNGTNSSAEAVDESHHNQKHSADTESAQSPTLKQPKNTKDISKDEVPVTEEQEDVNSRKVNESTDDDDVVQINAEPADDLEHNRNDVAQLDRGESPELNYSPDRDNESGEIDNRLKNHEKEEIRDQKNVSESEGSESDSGGDQKKGVLSSVSQVDSSMKRRIAEAASEEGAEAEEEGEGPEDHHQDDNDIEELKGLSENNDTQDIEEIAVPSTFACLPRDQRKRRWGTCRTAKKETPVIISTDSLKELIPDVKPLTEEELKFSDGKSSGDEDEEEGEIRTPRDLSDDELYCDQQVILADEKPASKKKEKEKDEGKKSEKREKDSKDARKSSDKQSKKDSKESRRASSPEVNNKGKQVIRKISILSEEAKKLARPPTPPKNVPSPVLLITNLVRPFTILQLRELLQRTGKIKEGGFWIDSIKSKCFVEFENEDQAVETRHALHDVRWPVSNPKLLHVDFAKKEDLAKAQSSTAEGGNRKVENIMADPYSVKKMRANAPVREWDVGKPSFPDEVIIDDRIKGPRGFEDVKMEHVRERERDRKDRTKDRDREKERNRERDHERDRDKDRKSRKERYGRSRSPLPHEPPSRRQRRKDDEAPAKLLDDLFCKTKASPCIYWLPLSSEQIALKEEQRRQHIEELEKRMANNSRERAKEMFKERDRDRDKDREKDKDKDRRKDRSRDRDHSSHRK